MEEKMEFTKIPHPDLDHSIAKNGQIINKYGKWVGTYYGLEYKRRYYNITDLLFLTYGTRKRKGEYLPVDLRKKCTRKVLNEFGPVGTKYSSKTWDEYKSGLIVLWHQISGNTFDFSNYFHEIFGMSIDIMVEKACNYLKCDKCIEILEYDNLIMDWGGTVTHEYLSLTLFKYVFKRITDDNEHFAARYRLYPEEYRTFGKVVQELFRDNLAADYGDGVNTKGADIDKIKLDDNSDFKRALNYDDFHSDINVDFGCSELVLSNIDLTIKENGKRVDLPEIDKQKFNSQFRKIIELNQGKYPLSHLFVEYSPYFFMDLWYGFRRLDTDLQKLIIKEL